jgi:hypothetical protein
MEQENKLPASSCQHPVPLKVERQGVAAAAMVKIKSQCLAFTYFSNLAKSFVF